MNASEIATAADYEFLYRDEQRERLLCKAKLFDASKSLRGQSKGLQRQARRIKNIMTQNASLSLGVQENRKNFDSAMLALSEAQGMALINAETVREQQKEIERLLKALYRYGNHDRDCESDGTLATCFCGFSAALEKT